MLPSQYDAASVANRDETINGQPQRIAPIAPEDLSDDALAIINNVRGSIGAPPVKGADVPGYFLTMVKHPAMLKHQLEMGAAIFKGLVLPRQRELAVLRIGWRLGAPYEWGEHVDIGKRCGLTDEEIERIIDGPDSAGWTTHDAAILRAVDELLTDHALTDDTWSRLADHWTEPQLIEFLMLVGQYVATALVQNALRIRLAPDNPGLSYR